MRPEHSETKAKTETRVWGQDRDRKNVKETETKNYETDTYWDQDQSSIQLHESVRCIIYYIFETI